MLQLTSAELPPRQLRRVTSPGGCTDDLGIVVWSEGASDLMVLEGEIDLATAPALHAVLHQLLTEGRRHVSVDFGSVTFLDATALTFLVAAGRDLATVGGSLTIVGRNPLLTRLLTVAGLTGMMDN